LRYARTLVEAYLYLDLTAAADESGAGAGGDVRARTTLTEGPDAWTLRFAGSDDAGGGRPEPVDVQVRYATEDAARRRGLRFGADTSELIDAGQWVQLSTVYARRALRAGIAYAQDPTDERYHGLVADWTFARDAAIEAAKFLPEGAQEVPDEAFWTPLGTETRRQASDRFTRDRLDRDIAFYQQSLEDARRRRGGAA
jgi:hypothetical protein